MLRTYRYELALVLRGKEDFKQLLSVTVVGTVAGLCAGYMIVSAQPGKPEDGRGG